MWTVRYAFFEGECKQMTSCVYVCRCAFLNGTPHKCRIVNETASVNSLTHYYTSLQYTHNAYTAIVFLLLWPGVRKNWAKYHQILPFSTFIVHDLSHLYHTVKSQLRIFTLSGAKNIWSAKIYGYKHFSWCKLRRQVHRCTRTYAPYWSRRLRRACM